MAGHASLNEGYEKRAQPTSNFHLSAYDISCYQRYVNALGEKGI